MDGRQIIGSSGSATIDPAGGEIPTANETGSATAATTIRVASVPASHVYVRHLSPVNGTVSELDTGKVSVTRLADPVPADGAKVPGGWWPPLMLDPSWIAQHHNDFDVFHIHFGFDAVEPSVMSAVVAELRKHGKPLVYTLHDLRNPHHPDPGAHEEVLDILVPAADELITPTHGAADAISRRWNRAATVIPHPHVIPPARFGPREPATDDFVVGVHAKSVRANMDPLPVILTLLDAASDYPDVTIQINLHDEIFVPGNHWYNPDFGTAALALSRHPYASVRSTNTSTTTSCGTTSRECRSRSCPTASAPIPAGSRPAHDLGTAVIAPSCGFYHEQRDCLTYELTEDRFDPDSLVAALADAYENRPVPALWPDRRTERISIAEQHAALYTRVLHA